MEVLSQRTRAVAAERALADVVQDNKKLQEYIKALEVCAVLYRLACPVRVRMSSGTVLAVQSHKAMLQLASGLYKSRADRWWAHQHVFLEAVCMLGLDTAVVADGAALPQGAVASLKLSPSAALTAFDDYSTDETRQELHRLAALLQQRDTEGHEQKQKMQSLQQEQLVVQQSTDTIKTWATAHIFPLDEQTLSSKASMYDIPRFGDFEEAMLQQANSWKQSQQQQQQHRVHGGFSSTAGGSALQGALAPEAAACHTEGGCSVLSAASGHSTNSTHVRELKLWFESAQQQAVAPERSKGGRSVGSACQEQT
jgi:hypothetical protein